MYRRSGRFALESGADGGIFGESLHHRRELLQVFVHGHLGRVLAIEPLHDVPKAVGVGLWTVRMMRLASRAHLVRGGNGLAGLKDLH